VFSLTRCVIEQDLGNIKFGLFSATFPKAARDLAKDHLAASHVRFRVGRAGSTTQNIKQRIIQIDRSEKRDVLISLLHDLPGVRTIIFVNSRFEADSLDDFLFNSKLPVTSIHGERTQVEREYAMRAFRSGNAPILVATGVSARGIDVRNVMHVINFNLPSIEHGGIEEYTHRIGKILVVKPPLLPMLTNKFLGRTGRIGHRGLATSFYTEHDEPLASVLTRTLLETEQEIPDFLEQYVPDGYAKGQGNLKFETESDFDPNDLGSNEFGGGGESGGGGGWGGDADANAGADAFGAAEPSGDGAAWGAEPAAPTAPAGDSGDTWGANPSPSGHGGQNANPSTDNAGWGGNSDANTGGGGW
jgi:ATP-dependent RNA helicase DDX3X